MSIRNYAGRIGIAALLTLAGCATGGYHKAVDNLGVKESELVQIGNCITTAPLKERIIRTAKQLAEREGTLEQWIERLLKEDDGDGVLTPNEVKRIEQFPYSLPSNPYSNFA